MTDRRSWMVAAVLSSMLLALPMSCGDAEPEGMKLAGADLVDAFLAGADRRNAEMRGADLRGAVLDGADLRGADLADAKLRFVSLSGADLRGAKGLSVELLKGCLYEPARPPRLDDGLAASAIAKVDESQSIAAPSGETWAGLRAQLSKLGQRPEIRVTYAGPSLTALAENPESADFAAFVARLRAATRVMLHTLAADGTIALEEQLDGEVRSTDLVTVAIGDRKRAIPVLSELADIRFAGAGGPVLSGWNGPEVLEWSILSIAKKYRVAMFGDDEQLGRYAKFAKELSKRGFDVVKSNEVPSDCDVVLVLAPRRLDEKSLAAASNAALLLMVPHDTPPEVEATLRPFLEKRGFDWGKRQVHSGARDPMSGETTFGSRTGTIVVLGDGFGARSLVSRVLRQGESIVEVESVRPLRARDATPLLTSPPFAWLGTPADKPKDKSKLESFPIAWLGDRLGVVAGTCVRDDQIHIGNTNLEFAARLVEALARP